jgi:anaerobic magnesium-protoporphyrin IX monomethyl ester cyclase
MSTPVVLINPPVEIVKEEHDAPPQGHIGLAYLGAALRQNDINCTIIDAKLSRLSFQDVVESVSKLNPRIVGITSFSHEINIAAKMAATIKERMSGNKIVIGGAHASSLPEETLRSFSSFDFLVKGEGEHTFTALVQAMLNGEAQNISSLPGVGYRSNGNVFVTPKEKWINDLDSLSFPAWDLFPSMKLFPVISSRGCPFKCVFCAKMLGDRIRLRSPENVIAELNMLHEKFGAKDIIFFDETFGFHKKWLNQFLDDLIISGLNQKLKWGIITRAHLLTQDVLQKFKQAGCMKIDFGVESGNEQILKIIKKGETKEDFIRAARLIKEAGIKSHSYYILGHPYETKETAIETIDFAAKLNTDYISIGIMIPYPGTEVAKLAAKGEAGYKKLSSNWSDYNKQLGNAIELESLSRAELTKLQLLGYLNYYLKNIKIIPFIKDIWIYRNLIISIIIKYFKQL